MTSVLIRLYDPRRDREELLRLLALMFPDCAVFDLSRWLADFVESENRAIFVVPGPEGTLLGYLAVGVRRAFVPGPELMIAYLESFLVDPSCRRQGIGTALHDEAGSWAKAHGFKTLHGDTEIGNVASRAARLATGSSEVERVIHFERQL